MREIDIEWVQADIKMTAEFDAYTKNPLLPVLIFELSGFSPIAYC